MTNIEQRPVFALATSDKGPIIIIGIPKGAWDYMKDGHTTNFSLRSA